MLGSQAAAADLFMQSYGRMPVGINLSPGGQGGAGSPAQIVAHPPRLDADPYVEMGMAVWKYLDDADLMLKTTPAIQGEWFAYSGAWAAQLAVREMYMAAELPLGRLWAGARMYRGRDLYLLDFWPMDDLDLVGGGGGVRWDSGRADLALGLNRLRGDAWQYQTRAVPVEGGVGTEEVLTLDRQRAVAALSAEQILGANEAKVYLEGHFLPAGTRYLDDHLTETLPSDGGFAAGIAWRVGDEDAWAQLWYRGALGLAALDELQIPSGAFDTQYRTTAARRHRIALEGGWLKGSSGWMAGGYFDRYADADGVRDQDDRWEGAAAARYQWLSGNHLCMGLELSGQWLAPDGLNPRSQQPELGQILRLQFLPAWQLSYGHRYRPQLRLQYSLSLLNQGARLQFPAEDLRAQAAVQHRIGLAAEWWMDEKVR